MIIAGIYVKYRMELSCLDWFINDQWSRHFRFVKDETIERFIRIDKRVNLHATLRFGRCEFIEPRTIAYDRYLIYSLIQI